MQLTTENGKSEAMNFCIIILGHCSMTIMSFILSTSTLEGGIALYINKDILGIEIMTPKSKNILIHIKLFIDICLY